MPIFEFQCEECGEIFEELILDGKIDDITCRKCKSPKVKKLISKVSFKSEGKFVNSSGSSCNICKGGTCSTCK